ncbi:MAG: Gfo/Idh/MocA family oxidoreductase [Firmicutes bacterium]|nr:Gfo/Idh/MocA family oxidoreductase [Bacillota bacterium]
MKKVAVIGEHLIHRYVYPSFFNGFDPELMEKNGGWAADLVRGKTTESIVPGARINYIWCGDRQLAENLAATCFIDNVADRFDEMVDEVDAVMILEDDGNLHLGLARPYIERGKAVFFDKPFACTARDARAIVDLARKYGAKIIAGSALKYSVELNDLLSRVPQDAIKSVYVAGPGQWLNYGVHVVEALQTILGSGAMRVRNVGTEETDLVCVDYQDGRFGILQVSRTICPGFSIVACTKDSAEYVQVQDSYHFYSTLAKAMGKTFVGGEEPFPLERYIETAEILEAGERSLRLGGLPVDLSDLV